MCGRRGGRGGGRTDVFSEEGLVLEELIDVAVVGYAIRPVVGQHDVQGDLQLCQAEHLQLPHVVRTPHGVLAVWRPLKVTLRRQWSLRVTKFRPGYYSSM